MKALAAVLLLGLVACGSVDADTAAKPAPRPAADKPLPFAPPPPPMPEEAGSCAADVKQCPDGSYVSRDPDNACAFKPCPGENDK
jgi:hypothetical protein